MIDDAAVKTAKPSAMWENRGGMKAIRNGICLLAFAAMAGAQPAAQPTTEQILSLARQAMGGPKLAAVKTLTVEGQAANGAIQSDVTLSFELPNKFLREQTVQLAASFAAGISPEMAAQVGSPTVVDCLNRDQQWSDIRMSADSQVESQQIERAAGSMLTQRRVDLRGTFTRYLLAFLLADRPDFPIQFAVVDQIPTPDGGSAYALAGKGPGDFALRLFIDSKTHLPMMMSHQSGDTETQIWLSKYKNEDGINIPHLMSWMQGERETERLEVKKVRINPKFPDGKFVKGG